MKRSLVTLAVLTLVVTSALGQRKRNDSVEAQIVALEKRAFEAWKNKNREFFEDHMSEAGQYLDLNGVGGKAQLWVKDEAERINNPPGNRAALCGL